MKKQPLLSLEPMIFPEDKNEIAHWQEKYQGDKDFESIEHFILEDQTFVSLGEVIETNHEIFPIGDDERKYAFIARNESGEIVAWVLVDFFNINSKTPELFLQYIVIHPKHQHKGYGEFILKEMLFNSQKYIGGTPKNFFALIDNRNSASKSLFEKFGFNFSKMSSHILRAETAQPNLEVATNSNNFGE